MQNIVGQSREELLKTITELGEKPFRVKQLWHWIYNRGQTDFELMTTLAKPLREKLSKNFFVGRPEIVTCQHSKDKTRKWLLRFEDGAEIESVYIPEDDRGAFCLSTQAGCAAGCRFCNTGNQGFVRDLSAYEIVSQFMVARDTLGEWPPPTIYNRMLSNIVVMGMGEPLFNYENVVKALKIIMDEEGLAISKRKITLSTCGVVPNIIRAAKDLGVKLAISLHASTDEIRNKIMPINRKYPLDELMKSCQEYQNLAGTRQRITFEYIMLDGINDTEKDALNLINLMKTYNIEAKFNLIAFNAWQGCEFKSSPSKTIQKFASIIESAHYPAPIRASRGQDILAACGQLRADNQEQNRIRR